MLTLVGGGALGVAVGLSLGPLGLLVLVGGGGVLPPVPLPPAPPLVGTGVLLGVEDESEPDGDPDELGDGAAVGGADWMAAVRSSRTLAIAARMTAARSGVIAPLVVSACTAAVSFSN